MAVMVIRIEDVGDEVKVKMHLSPEPKSESDITMAMMLGDVALSAINSKVEEVNGAAAVIHPEGWAPGEQDG